MTHKIFWSWQSDAPKRETRDLIQVALYAAVQDVSGEFDKAKRIEVDQDVKGVIGMAPIAETILDKIDAATVFVGDVTPVAVIGKGRNRKLLPNPNVMLELGYARRALSMGRLIPVFNRAIRSTRFDDLPFDLRHLTGTIVYELAEGALKSELRRVRKDLRKRLAEKLRAMIADAPGPVEPEQVWHASLPSDPSIWEEAYNPLPVNCPHLGQVDLIVAPAPRIFVRLLPAVQGVAPKSINGIFPGGHDCLLPIGASVGGGLTTGRTGNGHAIFQSVGEDRTTKSVVRWYKDTGEIWAISAWGFYYRNTHPHFAYDEVIKDLVSWLTQTLRSARTAGGSAPFRVLLGASGLRQVQWFLARPSLGSKPFLGLKDIVTSESILKSDERAAVVETVSKFMDEMTENFGVADLTLQQVVTLADSV